MSRETYGARRICQDSVEDGDPIDQNRTTGEDSN